MQPLPMNLSVYQATRQYPVLIGLIASLGFPQIRNGFLRKTMGKNYSLSQAADALGLDKKQIEKLLHDHGFEPVYE